MDIPPEILKCVVFVGYRKNGQSEKFAGSAFFLGRASDNSACAHVVTARHVVDSIRGKQLGTVLLRVNSRSGTARWLETSIKDWTPHPDKCVDVAVLRFEFTDDLDHATCPIMRCLTDEIIRAERIGVGNEVFLTGLFHHHYGKQNNIPIVRVGNIAAMPSEKVSTGLGPADAYLIEARSIGGLSGSPVFLTLGSIRSMSGLAIAPESFPRFYLVGLMHGHFDLPEDNLTDELIPTTEDFAATRSVNMGIAIVVPIGKVLEMIVQPGVNQT